jgi:hypothetical protein
MKRPGLRHTPLNGVIVLRRIIIFSLYEAAPIWIANNAGFPDCDIEPFFDFLKYGVDKELYLRIGKRVSIARAKIHTPQIGIAEIVNGDYFAPGTFGRFVIPECIANALNASTLHPQGILPRACVFREIPRAILIDSIMGERIQKISGNRDRGRIVIIRRKAGSRQHKPRAARFLPFKTRFRYGQYHENLFVL